MITFLPREPLKYLWDNKNVGGGFFFLVEFELAITSHWNSVTFKGIASRVCKKKKRFFRELELWPTEILLLKSSNHGLLK